MMLVSIYHMILTGETFNPSDYESFKNPKPPIKQQVLPEESAIEFLKKSGFDVSKLTKPQYSIILFFLNYSNLFLSLSFFIRFD